MLSLAVIVPEVDVGEKVKPVSDGVSVYAVPEASPVKEKVPLLFVTCEPSAPPSIVTPARGIPETVTVPERE